MTTPDTFVVGAVAAAVALFFSPIFIAFYRNHQYRWVIFAICIVAGWTAVAWVVAFAWAVWPSQSSSTGKLRLEASVAMTPADRLEQLERLGRLKAASALTETEFQAEKNRILRS